MPIEPLQQEDLIELWRRIMPPSYAVPIEEEQLGQGFDVPSAHAEIFADADQQVNEVFGRHYLKPSAVQTADPASGPARATTQVQILRNTSTVGDLLLDQGTRLLAQQQGSLGQTVRLVDFELAEPTLMPNGVRGPVLVDVQSTVDGYVGNVAAGSIVGFVELGRATVPVNVSSASTITKPPPALGDPPTDSFTLGMIGRFMTLVGLPSGVNPPFKITAVDVGGQIVTVSPPLKASDIGATGVTAQVAEYEDLGLEVTQPEDATGGLLDTLGAIGTDRRAGRVAGETDTQYRDRLCELADTVSPAAIERTATRILTPCGVGFRLKETREVGELMGFTWDVHPFDFGQLAPINNGAGDYIGEGGVYLDTPSAWTFFLICVGVGNDGEFGAPYDASPPGLDPPNAWSQFFWDGSPVGYNSCIGQLYDAVNGARAAGVNFLILQDPTIPPP